MRILTFCLFSLIIISCAQIRIERIDTNNADQQGLRFFRPHPYLLVNEAKNGGLTIQTIMLPDMEQEYVVYSTTGFGSTEITAKLQDGWNLVEIGQVSEIGAADISKPLLELTGQFKTMQQEELQPGLYRFEYVDGKVNGLKKIF